MDQDKAEQQNRIAGILANCRDKNVNVETLAVFYQLLKKTLALPCDVVCISDLENYELYAIENSGDDFYGILGKLKLSSDEKKEVVIPLCDLKAADNRSLEYMLLLDYASWFVNAQL